MWKIINSFEDYEISTDGEVKSHKGGKEVILKGSYGSNGYYTVGLCKNGKIHTKSIHRLVAEHFIDNPNNYSCIDHINGVRTDNRSCNLRWCSHKDNSNYEIAKKNMSKAHKGKVLTEEHKNKISKSNKGKPKPHFEKRIDQYTIDGTYIKTWKSTMEIERSLGFIHNNISSVCKGKYKQAYGFKWKYNGID